MPSNNNSKTIALGALTGFAVSGALAAGLVFGMRNASTTPSDDTGNETGVIAPMFSPAEEGQAASQQEAAAPGQGAGVINPQPAIGGAAPEPASESVDRVPSTLNDGPSVPAGPAVTEPAGPATSPGLPPIVTPTPTPETAPPPPTVTTAPTLPDDGGSDDEPADDEPDPGDEPGDTGDSGPLIPTLDIDPCDLIGCAELLPPPFEFDFDLEPEPDPAPPIIIIPPAVAPLPVQTVVPDPRCSIPALCIDLGDILNP